MSDKPFDPMAAWQDMLRQWEIQTNDWSGKLTETEGFSAAMNQLHKSTVLAQKTFAETTEKLLKSLNLPSKTQLDTVLERLDAIEEEIARLRLSLGQQPGARPAPKRTRKPPA